MILWEFRGFAELQVPLRLQSTEVVGDGIVWARYLVRGDQKHNVFERALPHTSI
jgi:hypothetical protein